MKILVSLILEFFWRLWSWTIRCDIQGIENVDAEMAQGCVPVFAVPHHTILLAALGYRHRRATVLASLSSDGEIAAQFMEKRGFQLVRGSSSRGGKEALESLKNALILGEPVAITFDGPRGPRLVPKPGIGICAWHATGSLYLLKIKVLPSLFNKNGLCLRLNSWDQFVVPFPFARLSICFEKLVLPEKEKNPLEEWVRQTLSVIQFESAQFYAPTAAISVTETCST